MTTLSILCTNPLRHEMLTMLCDGDINANQLSIELIQYLTETQLEEFMIANNYMEDPEDVKDF